MSEAPTPPEIDAYHLWLGIEPHEQPPHHYRLLGVALFEQNQDVIMHASDRQMLFVRQFQSGAHQSTTQKILNEIAAARVCLLNPASKAKYDSALRQSLTPPGAVGLSVPIDVLLNGLDDQLNLAEISPPLLQASVAVLSPRPNMQRRPHRSINVVGHIVAPLVGLTLGWLILQWIYSTRENVRLAQTNDEKQSAAPPLAAPLTHAGPAVASGPRNNLGPSNPSILPASPSIEITPTAPAAEMQTIITPEVDPSAKDANKELMSELPQATPADPPGDTAIESTDLSATSQSERAEPESPVEVASISTRFGYLKGTPIKDDDSLRSILAAAFLLFDEALVTRDENLEAIATFGLVLARQSKENLLIRRATLNILKINEIATTAK